MARGWRFICASPFYARREKSRERSAEFAVQCAFEIHELSADIVAKQLTGDKWPFLREGRWVTSKCEYVARMGGDRKKCAIDLLYCRPGTSCTARLKPCPDKTVGGCTDSPRK